MTLITQFLFAMMVIGFLYSLKHKCIHKLLKVLIATVAIIGICVLCFFAFEIGMFYNFGDTIFSDSKYFINLFFSFDKVYNPIVLVHLKKEQNEYEVCVAHKYAGMYHVSVCENFQNGDEVKYLKDTVFMSVNISDKSTDEEIYSAETQAGWIRQIDHISYHGINYVVDDNCPLRKKVKMVIKFSNVNEILANHPNAYLKVQYGFKK